MIERLARHVRSGTKENARRYHQASGRRVDERSDEQGLKHGTLTVSGIYHRLK